MLIVVVVVVVVVVMRDEQGEKKEPKSVSVWRIKRNLTLKRASFTSINASSCSRIELSTMYFICLKYK